MSRKKNYLFPGVLFLIFSFYTVFLLRFGSKELVTIFYIVIITCVSTDIGGYVFGKLFKGPKLTKISPNKTFSGMLGGYFFSITILNIFIKNKYFFNNPNIKLDNNLDFSLQTFVLIFFISTISQIGDLIVSYFKRISKIKNTGKLIPGHGGILDRIDGMIFAFPFSYLLILFLK
jgi:phosphatidate cytidylyltransferase